MKPDMGLIPKNPTNLMESPIWKTLIPSHPELPSDIDNSDGYENEEDDYKDDDLSPVRIESEEADYMCYFEAFQISLCNNMKIQSQSRAIPPNVYCLVML